MSDRAITVAIDECFERPYDTARLERLHGTFELTLMAILIDMEPRYAQDAYQAAFAKFIDTFRAGRRAGIDYVAYFVAIAKNCLIDEIRARHGTAPFDDLLEQTLIEQIDPIEQADSRIILLQQMMRLSPRCRYTLHAYYVRDQPVDRIASDLGIQSDSVYVLLQRCRDGLKKLASER